MNPINRQCAGKWHRPVAEFPAGYWLASKEQPNMTFCPVCVKWGVLPLDQLIPFDHSKFHTMACDGPAFFATNCANRVVHDNFNVKVVSQTRMDTYVIAPEKRKAAKTEGVGVFMLPTQAEFAIEIELGSNLVYGGHAFSIESFMIGDQLVKVFKNNNDSTVRITKSISVGTLTPGGKAFKFVSVTAGEKARGEVEPEVAAGYGEDNKITINLQIYKRVAACLLAPDPTMFHRGMSYSAHRTNDETQPAAKSGLPLTSGTTVAGSTNVAAIPIVTTKDAFFRVGSIVTIMLQLACFQTDAEKEADNKRAELHEKGYDYWSRIERDSHSRIERLKAEIATEQNRMQRSNTSISAILDGQSAPSGPLYDTDYISTSVARQISSEQIKRQHDELMILGD